VKGRISLMPFLCGPTCSGSVAVSVLRVRQKETWGFSFLRAM
jgi:hypothetical protein